MDVTATAEFHRWRAMGTALRAYASVHTWSTVMHHGKVEMEQRADWGHACVLWLCHPSSTCPLRFPFEVSRSSQFHFENPSYKYRMPFETDTDGLVLAQRQTYKIIYAQTSQGTVVAPRDYNLRCTLRGGLLRCKPNARQPCYFDLAAARDAVWCLLSPCLDAACRFAATACDPGDTEDFQCDDVWLPPSFPLAAARNAALPDLWTEMRAVCARWTS